MSQKISQGLSLGSQAHLRLRGLGDLRKAAKNVASGRICGAKALCLARRASAARTKSRMSRMASRMASKDLSKKKSKRSKISVEDFGRKI